MAYLLLFGQHQFISPGDEVVSVLEPVREIHAEQWASVVAARPNVALT
jgi:hypothetical protein